MPIVTLIGSTQMVLTELFNELMPSRPEIRCLLFNTEAPEMQARFICHNKFLKVSKST